MDIQEERWLDVKSKITKKKLNVKKTCEIFGFSSYEGFKRAVKENRKNRYYEVINYLQDL